MYKRAELIKLFEDASDEELCNLFVKYHKSVDARDLLLADIELMDDEGIKKLHKDLIVENSQG